MELLQKFPLIVKSQHSRNRSLIQCKERTIFERIPIFKKGQLQAILWIPEKAPRFWFRHKAQDDPLLSGEAILHKSAYCRRLDIKSGD